MSWRGFSAGAGCGSSSRSAMRSGRRFWQFRRMWVKAGKLGPNLCSYLAPKEIAVPYLVYLY